MEWAHFIAYSISQYSTYGFIHTRVLWINFTCTSDLQSAHTATVQVVSSHSKPFLYICCTSCSTYICNMATVYKECLLTIIEEFKSNYHILYKHHSTIHQTFLDMVWETMWYNKEVLYWIHSYTRGGQLDDHQEPHFRRQLRSEPCIYNHSEMCSTNTAHCLGECRQHRLLTTQWNTVV